MVRESTESEGNTIGNYDGLIFNLPPAEIPKINLSVKAWLSARNIPILPVNMAD